jgi:hypothetical protein
VLNLSSEALAELARGAGVDLDRRGETLSVAEFARMAELAEAK